LQKDALAGEIYRRYLQAMARPHDDQSICGEPVDGIMDRRSAKAGYFLKFLHCQEAARSEFAIDQQILNALISQLEMIDAVQSRWLGGPARFDKLWLSTTFRHPAPSKFKVTSASSN
jgi:hypothetical protein